VNNGSNDAPEVSKEKLDKRAERFGTAKPEEKSEVLEKRMKRFGSAAAATDTNTVPEEKLNKRKERFAIVNEDVSTVIPYFEKKHQKSVYFNKIVFFTKDKKKLRTERFEAK
jgi:hypothetical protein